MQKLVVILGPTASGKSSLAVKLARRFSGQIISADSRQVYKGLNIGSGKITKKEMAGIPHYLLDVANPRRKFTVSHFKKIALVAINKIHKQGKLPFLVGGTGFYIQAIVDNIALPEVKPNAKLRKELEKKSVEELFLMLKKLDPGRAAIIDAKNPRRLIRAIEIITITGQPVPVSQVSQQEKLYGKSRGRRNDTILQIGIKKNPKELKELIAARLKKRVKGIITEVRNLYNNGLSWKRLEELGLEYRFVAQYLQQKISRQEMMNKIQIESAHFAKRQMTWFKRDTRIHWVNTQQEAQKLLKNFLV